MRSQLPPPSEIADHYNTLLRELKGEYLHSRWGDSEIKRRHYGQTRRALQHAIARIPTIGDVLEIGCGPAVWTPLFLQRASSVHLLDISEEMLAQARAALGEDGDSVRYTCGDFLEAPLEEASCDTIISARAFEYMADKAAFVRKCVALLRPGGTLVVATKNQTWRDLVRTARDLEQVPRERIPTGLAMQLDLVPWQRLVEMYHANGLTGVEALPVVAGSYHRPYTWRLGLEYADRLHARIFQRSMSMLSTRLESLVESYLVTGRKGR